MLLTPEKLLSPSEPRCALPSDPRALCSPSPRRAQKSEARPPLVSLLRGPLLGGCSPLSQADGSPHSGAHNHLPSTPKEGMRCWVADPRRVTHRGGWFLSTA